MSFEYNFSISEYLPLSNKFPNKPNTVPENIAIPSSFFNNSLKGTFGSDSSSLFRYDKEESSIILL